MERHSPPTYAPARPDVPYRSLVEQVPAIVYIADFQGARPFLYVSPQAEELLGYPPEEWVADPDLWNRLLHPEDRERVLAEERRTLNAVEPFEAEYRLVARDGRVVWFWERDAIFYDEDGEPLYTQGVLWDVTDLKRARTELQEERDRAQRYLDIAGTLIVVLDSAARVSLVNRSACGVLGWSESELVGRDWFEVAVPDGDRAARRTAFERMMAGEASPRHDYEAPVVTRRGEERLIAWHDTLVRDADGRVTGTLSSGEDVTERRRAQEQLVHLAYHDRLTNLPNRALLADRLAAAVARAEREHRSAALLCLDLDDFKLVNDSLGHTLGDDLLGAIARRLESATRHGDFLAHAGGDEFFLLLSDLPAQGDRHAAAAARRTAEALSKPFDIAGAEFHLSASVGISLFPRDAEDADELLRHANAAVFQAKRASRAGYALYEPQEGNPLERLSLTARLHRALAHEELVLHWQPIYSLDSGLPVGLEALVRWQDPERGLVAPAEFIPAAEHSGLIEPIGEWVIEQMARQAAQWRRLGLTPRISVNASARELRRPDYARLMATSLDAREVPPSQVLVEVTESAAMDGTDRATKALADLDELGVGLAIDDFGEGFSSLSRLREMPVEQLKIDRSFMREVPASDRSCAVVNAIVHLAEALGREVVAEGVETEEQRRFLIEQGCPLAQGFHLAPPLPAAEVTALLLRA
jgi:diguanylate cyclase (GGDEF)-like protein/PAS domain S-box-containing protein